LILTLYLWSLELVPRGPFHGCLALCPTVVPPVGFRHRHRALCHTPFDQVGFQSELPSDRCCRSRSPLPVKILQPLVLVVTSTIDIRALRITTGFLSKPLENMVKWWQTSYWRLQFINPPALVPFFSALPTTQTLHFGFAIGLGDRVANPFCSTPTNHRSAEHDSSTSVSGQVGFGFQGRFPLMVNVICSCHILLALGRLVHTTHLEVPDTSKRCRASVHVQLMRDSFCMLSPTTFNY
jgi:hypothetical protein